MDITFPGALPDVSYPMRGALVRQGEIVEDRRKGSERRVKGKRWRAGARERAKQRVRNGEMERGNRGKAN